jgi:hypothetical protein
MVRSTRKMPRDTAPMISALHNMARATALMILRSGKRSVPPQCGSCVLKKVWFKEKELALVTAARDLTIVQTNSFTSNEERIQ